jgi:SNF2 family DNA or RNA helicase
VGSSRDIGLFSNNKPIIFVTTYDTLVRDAEQIQAVPFYFVVLDEATKIKNPDTMRTKAVKGINAVHRIALSGTPIENRPAELWSLFDFLIRGHLGTYGQFIRVFENNINAGDSQVASKLSNRIRPFILRRLKKDVAKDLPEKIEMDEWCELTDEQKFLYNQIQNQFVSPIRDSLNRGEVVNFATSILPILTKLKQVCDHPALINGKVEPIDKRSEKFDMVIDKVQEIRDVNEGVVIFSHFLRTLDLLEMSLKSRNMKYIRIDGSTQDRQARIDRFNQKQADAALCSIQACGHGINLTAANHVIHIDRWWNPAIEDQATDRVHRIGQNKNVYVYRIIVKGTLEEKIALLLDKKRNISDRVIGAAAREEMKWTRDELLEILKPLKS